MSSRNEKLIHEIKKMPGNNECADCGAPDPVWTSYQLGIFICVECSGIHRDLPEISKVKSVQLDYWNDEQIQYMKENGNLLAKVKYEANVPRFFYRPRPQDCLVLKEQWIRAKYQREEFTANKDISAWYTSGFKEGFLWKRGRDKKQFQSRKFVLSEEEGVLKYYMASDCKNPKSIISLRDLNAIFQPEKIGHRNGLAFIFMKGSQTRTIFVYHENGEDIVNWFNCIRAARLRYLKKALPDTPESELILKITRNYMKEGYMEKTGPTQREAFKKRWFTLDSLERKLLYYKTPMDAYEQGGVFIGSYDHGYKVTDVLPPGVRARNWRAGIRFETPERNFLLNCPNKNEQTEWMKALNEIISRPMTPQDYTAEASLRQNHKRSIKR